MVGRRKKSDLELRKKFGDKFIDILIQGGLFEEDLPESLKGKPVHIPQVNFDVPLEQKVRAKAGPPPYAVRAKYIEDAEVELRRDLAAQRQNLARHFKGDPQKFARVWKAVVETIELEKLNDLIAEHNRFYPIEANLKDDPETGQIMIGNTVWKPKKKLTPQKLLEDFPPDLDQALEGSR